MKPYEALTERGRIRRGRTMVDAVLPAYGLAGSRVRFLAYDWNLQFRIDAPDGTRYAMRISDPAEHPPSQTRTEVEWLNALAADTELNLARPVPRLDGELMTTVEVDGVPGERTVVLFSWIPGVVLEERLSPATYERLGVASAVLHQHSASYPTDGDAMRWDTVYYWPEEFVLHDDEVQPLLQGDRRRIVDESARLVDAELRQLWSSAHSPQLLHGDLHMWNAHVYRGRIYLFDFEDVMVGFPVQDVGITLFYGRERDDYDELAAAYRRGYERVTDWPARDDRQLRTLMAGRTLTFINWSARAQEDPEPYIKMATERLAGFLAG